VLTFEPTFAVAWVLALPAIATAVAAAAGVAGLGYQIAATEGAKSDAKSEAKKREKQQARLAAAEQKRNSNAQNSTGGLTWQQVFEGWRDQIFKAGQPAGQAPAAAAPAMDLTLPLVLIVAVVAFVLLSK
jgi:hypothetical protein